MDFATTPAQCVTGSVEYQKETGDTVGSESGKGLLTEELVNLKMSKERSRVFEECNHYEPRAQATNCLAQQPTTVHHVSVKTEQLIKCSEISANKCGIDDTKEVKLKTVMTKVFSNHLILKMMMQNLSFQDLLSSGLVSKSWYSLGRRILSEKFKCFATIKCSHPNEEGSRLFTEFNQVFSEASFCPISGISIQCNMNKCPAIPNMDFSTPNKLNLKYLHVSISCNKESNFSCYSMKLFQELMSKYSTALHEIAIVSLPPSITTVQHIFPPTSIMSASSSVIEVTTVLPNLQKLVIPSGESSCEEFELDFDFSLYTSHRVHDGLIASLMKAPSLQELTCELSPLLIPRLLEEKQLLNIKYNVHFRVKTVHDLSLCTQFYEFYGKMKSITIVLGEEYESIATTDDQVKDAMIVFFQAVAADLQVLKIDSFSLSFFTFPELQALTSLRQIYLNNDPPSDHAPVVSFKLQCIDFSLKFPNLQSVFVTTSYSQMSSDAFHYLTRPFPLNYDIHNSSTSVTTLNLIGQKQQPVDRGILKRMNMMFPNILHLYIENVHRERETERIRTMAESSYRKSKKCRDWDYANIFRTLWTLWPKLETIVCTGVNDDYAFQNLDPIFCGISDTNCRMLRLSNEYKNFEQLQMQPSIKELKDLKLFRMEFNHQSCPDVQSNEIIIPGFFRIVNTDSSDSFLTEVTGYCAFAQMPKLKVEINRKLCSSSDKKTCRLQLDCLSKFASVSQQKL